MVLIATYNEIANIDGLLGALMLHDDPAVDVLVVDDNSPDGTGDAVQRAAERHTGRIHLLRRAGKLGYGTAFVEGIARARELGATAIVSMDADLSHDPADVPALLRRLSVPDAADVVVGSRYIGGIRVLNWPAFRLMLSLFANAYARTLLGLAPRDVTSGFRAYRTEVLSRVDWPAVRARGYAFLVEVLYRLKRQNARMAEVPIVFSERRDGQSKMNRTIILEAAWRPWLLLTKRALGMIRARR